MSILFSEGQIGSLSTKNRFVCSATVECLTDENNHFLEAYTRRYEQLARNDVGLIIPGNYFILKSGCAVEKVMVLDNDEVIPELQKLTDSVHQHGAKIIAQINHGGRQCNPKVIKTQPVSASSVRDMINGIKPRALEENEIEEIIRAFGESALRIKKGGFDGVQINAAHGYLINQFLSSRTNRRKDQWGGSLQNRQRFLLRVYQSIREAVGDDFIVMAKINCQDEIKNGVTIDESIDLSKRLEALGLNAIEISGGIKETGFATTKGEVPKNALKKSMGIFKRFLFGFVKNRLKRAAHI